MSVHLFIATLAKRLLQSSSLSNTGSPIADVTATLGLAGRSCRQFSVEKERPHIFASEYYCTTYRHLKYILGGCTPTSSSDMSTPKDPRSSDRKSLAGQNVGSRKHKQHKQRDILATQKQRLTSWRSPRASLPAINLRRTTLLGKLVLHTTREICR